MHNPSPKLHEMLKLFPPVMRKFAMFIANADEFKSIAAWAKDCGMNPRTVYATIHANKKRDRDFDLLLQEIYKIKLARYRPLAYKNLVKGIQKGSAKHLEIYFTLLGDLKKESRIETNTTNSLTFILPMPTSIEEPKAIDVTPKEQYSTENTADRPLDDESGE